MATQNEMPTQVEAPAARSPAVMRPPDPIKADHELADRRRSRDETFMEIFLRNLLVALSAWST
jgi:hypothetical protein